MKENDINTCTLTGTITGKPLSGKTSSNKPFAVFSIVTKSPKVTTVKAACLGKTAVQIKPYLKPKSRLGVQGFLGESKNGIQIAVTSFINFSSQKQTASKVLKSASQTSSSTAVKSSASVSESPKSVQSSSTATSQRPAPKIPTSASIKRQARKSTSSSSSSSAQNPFAGGTPQLPRSDSSNATSSSSDDLPF